MYKKVLLAYDGSIEGRRALREGAKLAQLCRAEVFLLAVVEITSVASREGGLAIPIDEQIANYKAIFAEGVERLKALGFSPTARLGMGAAGKEIAEVAEEIGANLVVVGHRPSGPLVVRFRRHLPDQASSLQCLSGPNRNQRRSIYPANGGRRAGIDSEPLGARRWLALHSIVG
jgi:nucleotide-binding universal stress UspA family protein